MTPELVEHDPWIFVSNCFITHDSWFRFTVMSHGCLWHCSPCTIIMWHMCDICLWHYLPWIQNLFMSLPMSHDMTHDSRLLHD
jgi:hypothetical protein